jgi:hypothetical protein
MSGFWLAVLNVHASAGLSAPSGEDHLRIIQAERNPHELQSGGMPDESCALQMMSLTQERELADG